MTAEIISAINLSHNPSMAMAIFTGQDFFLKAVEEERLSRVKFYDDESYVNFRYNGRSKLLKTPSGKRSIIYTMREFKDKGLSFEGPVRLISGVPHHDIHALSAWAYSGFESCAILSVDGAGHGISPEAPETAVGYMAGDFGLRRVFTVNLPDSLGNLYFIAGIWAGLGSNPEGKLMALASFGDEQDEELLLDMIQLHEDGSFNLNEDMFIGDKRSMSGALPEPGFWIQERFGPAVAAGSKPGRDQIRLARAVQGLLNKVVIHMSGVLFKNVADMELQPCLCMAGGVALNSVANRFAFKAAPWNDIFIQPASYDAGLSLGMLAHSQDNCDAMPLKLLMDNLCRQHGSSGRIRNRLKGMNLYRENGISKNSSSRVRRVRSIARWTILDAYNDKKRLEMEKQFSTAAKILEDGIACKGRFSAPEVIDELEWSNAISIESKLLDLRKEIERLRRAESEKLLSEQEHQEALKQYLKIEEILPGRAAFEAGCLAKECELWNLSRRYLRLAVTLGSLTEEKVHQAEKTLAFVLKNQV